MFLFYFVTNLCGPLPASMYMFKVNNGNKVDDKDTRTTSLTSRHYSRAIWTSFYQFWVHVIWALELKILYICMKEKCKFFVNYDKWLQRSRNFHYEALETLKMLWLFSSVIMQNCECQESSRQGCASGHYQGAHSFPWTRAALVNLSNVYGIAGISK